MAADQRALRIATADDSHLDGMVAVHARAFPGEFLTLLGPAVLRAFYRFYIRQPQGIALVVVETGSGAVLGLVCGGEPTLRRRFGRRYAFRLVQGVVRGALQHRHVRQRLVEHLQRVLGGALRRLRGRTGGASSTAQPDLPPGRWSSLLSICADPRQRGRGIGCMLMEGFREESRRRGYELMRLSVHNDNQAARYLYERCGWSIALATASGSYFTRATEP